MQLFTNCTWVGGRSICFISPTNDGNKDAIVKMIFQYCHVFALRLRDLDLEENTVFIV